MDDEMLEGLWVARELFPDPSKFSSVCSLKDAMLDPGMDENKIAAVVARHPGL